MKINKDVIALAAIILCGILYYSVVLRSPIVFGDEGYYSSIGRWMTESGTIPVYEPYYQTDIYHLKFTKFPLHFFFNTAAWLLLGDLGIRLLIPLFSILSATMLYIFLRGEGRPGLGLASAFTLLMAPGMVTYGVLNYVETLNILLLVCALMFGYYAINKRSMRYSLLSGLFLGLALLTDLTALFAPLILLAYFLLSRQFVNWKNILIIFVLAGLVFSPFLIRNVILFNDFCHPVLPGDCSPKIDREIPHAEGLENGFIGGAPEGATGMGILKMGVLPYMRFAFGWTLSLLLLFGIASLINKRDKLALLISLWFAAFILLNVHQALFGGRAEDLARYTLFGFPAVALTAGLFVSNAYKWTVNKNKILAGILILVVGFSVWIYGQEKLDTMTKVKAFAPGFFEGCKWVKANTPEDALLFTIYGHHTAYHCDRANINNVPDKADIQLTNDDRSYEHLKLHGFDYVFVQEFTVSDQSYMETITTGFLNYLETSPNFKKVYDNTPTYGRSGVRLYQVL